MANKVELKDWEALVKKQLKVDDPLKALTKENPEGIVVQPFDDTLTDPQSTLPKIEETIQLVAPYHGKDQEDVYAYKSDSFLSNIKDKIVFVDQFSDEVFPSNESSIHFSLIDPFDSVSGELIEEKAEKLNNQPFERPWAIDVSFFQNAGASMVQQLAIALAKTKDLNEKYGDDLFSKVLFKLAVGSDFFLEVGKIRAFKLLLNQLSKEYGRNDFPYIFVETTKRNKTTSDPENNLIRSTLELAAGMIAGADALFSNNYTLATDDAINDEISFKQQILLAYESLINVFEDAQLGSYYQEAITQQLAEKAWLLFLEIEENGGFSQAMSNGFITKMVYQHASTEHQKVLDGTIKLTGVNQFPTLNPTKSVDDLYTENVVKPIRWEEAYL